ncbi:MAG: YceI family protein [bacterium]|nr:YceI family protein [bacterium]MDA1292193.1 YceI family protein [bacterium]
MTVAHGSPTDLFITFAIDSIVTDNEKLTTHLKSADFFDATTFPEAIFIADSFVDSGEGIYAITGMLTMHGVTKKEIVTAKITSTYLTATHVIDRTDYGIGGPADGLKAVDPAIPLDIKVVFN